MKAQTASGRRNLHFCTGIALSSLVAQKAFGCRRWSGWPPQGLKLAESGDKWVVILSQGLSGDFRRLKQPLEGDICTFAQESYWRPLLRRKRLDVAGDQDDLLRV